jgi:hypothetical protein
VKRRNPLVQCVQWVEQLHASPPASNRLSSLSSIPRKRAAAGSSINRTTSTSMQPTSGSSSCVKNKAPAAHRLIEHASLSSWEPQLNFCCIHSRPALVCAMASSATGTPKYVTLVSAEGHCFIVDYKCAMTSKTIKGNCCLPLRPSTSAQIVAAILTAPDGLFLEKRTGRIEFPEISTKILEKVCSLGQSFSGSFAYLSITGHRILLLQNSQQQHQQLAGIQNRSSQFAPPLP